MQVIPTWDIFQKHRLLQVGSALIAVFRHSASDEQQWNLAKDEQYHLWLLSAVIFFYKKGRTSTRTSSIWFTMRVIFLPFHRRRIFLYMRWRMMRMESNWRIIWKELIGMICTSIGIRLGWGMKIRRRKGRILFKKIKIKVLTRIQPITNRLAIKMAQTLQRLKKVTTTL